MSRGSLCRFCLATAFLGFLLCFLGWLPGCFFLCLLGWLLGRLFLSGFLGRFLFRGGFAAASSASAGGSGLGGRLGFGGRRRRSGDRFPFIYLRFRRAGFFFFLLFLFEVFFERLGVGSAVAEFVVFFTSIERGIVKRHCSS